MVAVLGHRRGGLEALVLQDAEGGGKASGGARDGLFEHGGQGAGAQVDDELVAAGGRCQQVSNDRRLVAVAADARADVAGGGAIEDLQMGDGRARAGEFGVQAFEQRTDYGGGGGRGSEGRVGPPSCHAPPPWPVTALMWRVWGPAAGVEACPTPRSDFVSRTRSASAIWL